MTIDLHFRKINEIEKSTKNMATENLGNIEMEFELGGNNLSTIQMGINEFATYLRQTKIFLYLYESFHILPPTVFVSHNSWL